MATAEDGRSHNQPSREAQVKGGEHTHQSSSSVSEASKSSSEEDGRSHNKPSHEALVKGGQNSHSAPSQEASVKGSESSHKGSQK